MIRLVIDANILFSALIKKGKTRDLVFDKRVTLYTPVFIFSEYERHQSMLMKKANISTIEFEKTLNTIKRRVSIIPAEKYLDRYTEAELFSPDPKDAPYIALAMKLNCAIWSQDKNLKEKQEEIIVYTTEDLVRLLKIGSEEWKSGELQ